MAHIFNFTTRDEYLAYRADWRAKYRTISQEIRDNKRQQAARKGQSNSALQSQLHYLRVRANELMVERTEATKFKNQQLAAPAVAAA